MSDEQLPNREKTNWHVHVPTLEELSEGKSFKYSHDFKFRLARRIEAKLIHQKHGIGFHPDTGQERVEPSKIHQLMHDPDWVLEDIAEAANRYRGECEYLEEVDYAEIHYGPQTWVYEGCLDAVDHARAELNSVVVHGYRVGLSQDVIEGAVNSPWQES